MANKDLALCHENIVYLPFFMYDPVCLSERYRKFVFAYNFRYQFLSMQQKIKPLDIAYQNISKPHCVTPEINLTC